MGRGCSFVTGPLTEQLSIFKINEMNIWDKLIWRSGGSWRQTTWDMALPKYKVLSESLWSHDSWWLLSDCSRPLSPLYILDAVNMEWIPTSWLFADPLFGCSFLYLRDLHFRTISARTSEFSRQYNSDTRKPWNRISSLCCMFVVSYSINSWRCISWWGYELSNEVWCNDKSQNMNEIIFVPYFKIFVYRKYSVCVCVGGGLVEGEVEGMGMLPISLL
jgi:hypothetical protein